MNWDYAKLQEEIVKFAMRAGDAEFEGSAATFISLGESALNRELPLREMQIDVPLVGTVGSRFIQLPGDFVEPYALHLTTFGETELRGPGIAGRMRVNASNGTPTNWCVNSSNIELNTPCDQAHTFVFRYRRSFALSESQPTNWLLTNHPDVYLAAALVWGGVFMRDTAEAAPWKAILDGAVISLAWTEARSTAIAPRTVDAALAPRVGFNIISG